MKDTLDNTAGHGMPTSRPDRSSSYSWVLQQLGVSATGGDTGLLLENVLPAYARMGYRFFEAWFTFRGSALDLDRGAAHYRELARRHGITFGSIHLSPVEHVDEESINRAVREIRFAAELGVGPATVTAATLDGYKELLREVLPRTEDTSVCPVVQFHEDGAFRGVEEMEELYREIQHPRLRYQLEVGSLFAAGIDVVSVIDTFASRLGLVHLKDMVGRQSVPLGSGDVDIRGILARLDAAGYRGVIVVEIANKDTSNTRRYFAEAVGYLGEVADDLANA